MRRHVALRVLLVVGCGALSASCVGFGSGRLTPPADRGGAHEEQIAVEVGADGGVEPAAPPRVPGPPHPLEGCWELRFSQEASEGAPSTRRLTLSTESGPLGGHIADADRLGEGHPSELHDVSATVDRIFFRTFHRVVNPLDATEPPSEVLHEVFEGTLDPGGVTWHGRSQVVGEARPYTWTGARCAPSAPTPARAIVPPPQPPAVPFPTPPPTPLLGCWDLDFYVGERPIPNSHMVLVLRASPGAYTGTIAYVPHDGPGYTRELVDVVIAGRNLTARTVSKSPMGENEINYAGRLVEDRLLGERLRPVGGNEDFIGARCRN